MFISILSTTYKYLLHTIDLQNENPWENKGIYMLYSDLVFGFLRVCLYFAFVGIMVRIHTFPLFAIRPIYMSLRFVLRQLLTNRLIYNYFCRTFKKCFNDVVLSRRAIRNLNNMYPTVTAEQLRSYADTICIICREEMNGDNQVKKLPCDHIFHKNCLRSWFQRQQTCPTCRTQVLRVNAQHIHTPVQPQQPAAAAPPQQTPVVNQQQEQQPQQQQQQQQQQTDSSRSSSNQPQQQQVPPPQPPQMNFNPSRLFSSIGQANIMPPFSKSFEIALSID